VGATVPPAIIGLIKGVDTASVRPGDPPKVSGTSTGAENNRSDILVFPVI